MDSICEKVRSLGDLQKLTPKELNLLLKKHGKSIKGKKSHKIAILATVLGLQVTECRGQQDSVKNMLNKVREIKNGWTKNIRLCPTVTMDILTTYLLRVHDTVTHTAKGDIEFTKENMTRYKTLRSWRLYDAGHVHSMAFLPMNDSNFCSVKAKCNPSFDTSGTVYEQIIMFVKETSSPGPVCSSCTCAAGQGEGCTHVAAVLFAMEDFSSRGHHTLPEDPSSTDILCAWNAPKGTKVESVPLKRVAFSKGTPGQAKKKRRLAHEPLAPHIKGVLAEEYHGLMQELNHSHPNVPFMRIADPEQYPLDQVEKEHIVFQNLPDMLPYDSIVVIPASEESVVTSPPDPPTVKDFMISKKDFILSADEQRTIELLTNGQSSNPKWYRYREGVITGSIIHQVNTKMCSVKNGKSAEADRLVKLCLGKDVFRGNKATLYGCANEAKAAQEYVNILSEQHTLFKVETCGLFLLENKCFLGGSPDRIVTCDCHGSWVLEIKCPASLADKPNSLQNLPYIQCDGDKLVLKKTHPYYSQVIWYMGLTGNIRHKAQLFVWTPHENVVLDVEYDAMKWQELLLNSEFFFLRFLLPEMKKMTSVTGVVDLRRSVVQENMCGTCNALLLGKDSIVDKTENSVQCECTCRCNSWHHWKCTTTPSRTAEEWENILKWICTKCVQTCSQ